MKKRTAPAAPTEEELRLLRPLVGEVNPDVVSRWFAPASDDVEIEAIIAQWRRHREMGLALRRKGWTTPAGKIDTLR